MASESAKRPTVLLAGGSLLTPHGSGPRDLVLEMRRMASGKSVLLPTLEHVESAVRHIDQLIEDVDTRDEMILELLTDLVAAETKARELSVALAKLQKA